MGLIKPLAEKVTKRIVTFQTRTGKDIPYELDKCYREVDVKQAIEELKKKPWAIGSYYVEQDFEEIFGKELM